MHQTIEIENIAELRRQAGIEDIPLGEEIGRLRSGDHVKLTFLSGQRPLRSETVLVRITSIKDARYRGKLTHSPAFLGLSKLRAGSLVNFTRDHIHSVAKRPLN